MTFASVVLDIPTRALDAAFDYAVPAALEAEAAAEASSCSGSLVGCTVLVPFSHRHVVGYVVALSSEPPAGVDPSKILEVERILASSAFDEASAEVARWIAREYSCPLCEAIRPFLAPGQTVKVRRASDADPWELVCEKSGPVDERWVSLTEAASSFEPRANASKQRAVLSALSGGPMRVVELSATLPGSAATVTALERKGIVSVERRRRVRGQEATSLSSATAARPEHLTAGQREALCAIDAACESASGDVVVVDGVTGSGKTEVYLEAIERVRSRGGSALVLVPEISLTAQTVGRFRSRFGDDVAILHSRLSAGERFDQWDLARSGQAHVVVGARSALFAPLADLGLVIIDEEHEASYKQDSAPRYHAREVAARICRERGCALVLGSATPSLESLERCRAHAWGGVTWTRVCMPERPGGATLPEVSVVDMTEQFASGRKHMFSKPLADALLDVARRREKAVLLLNRRGFANFLMCRECGAVPECPHCSTSLTYHERTHSLVCHSCERSWPIGTPGSPMRCPSCNSPYLGAYGVGTQQVETALSDLLADADVTVVRMDADTTKGKGEHQRRLEEFDAAESAVLVGTQMIAKGLDFPQVTLVGVINADTTLKMPDFRAAERTFDLLEQVAGRAGRGERAGRVIIQSYWAGHPAIQAVRTHDRDLFVISELAERRDGNYPPFSRLANVLCWGRSESDVRRVLDGVAAELRSRTSGRAGWEVLGPAECLKSRVKDRFRRHILVKAPVGEELGPVLDACVRAQDKPRGVNVAIDVDAYDMM